MRRLFFLGTIAVCTLLLVLITERGHAVVFDLKPVVSPGDPVVGMSGGIFPLGPPALDGQDLGFYGVTGDGVQGYFIYKFQNDAVLPAAVRQDRLYGPVNPGAFSRLESFAGHPSMHNGQLAGWANDGTFQHILVASADVPREPMALVNTSKFFDADGDQVAFQSFGVNPSIHDGEVAFQGVGRDGEQGVYSGTGEATLHVFANQDTDARLDEHGDATGIATFQDPSFDGDRVAFRGYDDRDGSAALFLYSHPLAGGAFASESSFYAQQNPSVRLVGSLGPLPQMDGRHVSTRIFDSEISDHAIYKWDRLEPFVEPRVAQVGDPVPFQETITDLGPLTSIENDHLVFEAFVEGRPAILSNGLGDSPVQTPVVAAGDIVGGRTVRRIAMQPDAVSGNRIALGLDSNTTGAYSLYVAEPVPSDLPEPGASGRVDIHYGNPTFEEEDQDYLENLDDPVFADVFGLRGPVPLDFDEAFAHGSGYLLGRDGQGTPTVHALSRAQGSFFRDPSELSIINAVEAMASGSATSHWVPRTSGGDSENIDVDVTLHLEGVLDVSTGAGGGENAPDFLEASVNFGARLYQRSLGDSIVVLSVHDEGATLDANGELSTSSGFSDISATPIASQYEDGVAYALTLDITIEDVTFVNAGEEDLFAISLDLETNARVFDPGGDELGAFADFLNSGGYTLSSDTPGVTFEQVPIPEPSSTVLIMVLACIGICLRLTRAFDVRASANSHARLAM